MKVYVFEKGFLTDYTDGLGVIFANNRTDAIEKMAVLVVGEWPNSIPEYIKDFSELGIVEYTLEEFPGVYTYGGA